MTALVRLAVEAGPLVVFFVVNGRYGLFPGTAAFMAATSVSVLAAWWLERRVPVMPLAAGVFVLVFGGLTLALQDELFIKLKPTIVNGLFAVILAGGMLAGRSLLKPVFGEVFRLDEAGWRILTWRWAAFFVVLAVLNEVVWRTQTTEFWISFKLFGAMPITLAFSIAQVPLLQRHALPEARDQGADAA